MKIWYFHNYTMLPEHGTLNRGYYLGKYWKRQGCEPVIFVGSHPHNTDLQLIEDRRKYCVYKDTPFPWVLIRTRKYGRSRIQQIISMVEYYFNAKKAANDLIAQTGQISIGNNRQEGNDEYSNEKKNTTDNLYGKPDVIIGSSAHPLAAFLAIRLSQKYDCLSVVEIRDLWPESIVDYGLLKKNNIIIRILYHFEKSLYTRADRIVFTQEAAYQYIRDKKWEKRIPESKVTYICNGTDREEFFENLGHYEIKDSDMDLPDTFKIVYTGAVKLVNNVGLLIDVAKEIKDPRVRIIIWGGGDELDTLKDRLEEEGVKNLVFKGYVEKKYIPSIINKSDLGLVHIQKKALLKYGFSPNKLFDYMTAGKPVIVDCTVAEDPVVKYNAGLETDIMDPKSVAKAIETFSNMPKSEYDKYCKNARKAAALYSYENLAGRYISHFRLHSEIE